MPKSPRRQSKQKFYAVAVGRETGVYHSWADCEQQVKKYSGALFQSFPTWAQATAFVQTHAKTTSSTTTTTTNGSGNKRSHTALAKKESALLPPSSSPSVPPTNHPKPKRPRTNDNDKNKNDYTWKVKLMFDGGSRGNPGPAGAGAFVTMQKPSSDGKTTTAMIRIRHFVGTSCTNNEAEYAGLCQGLQAIRNELDKEMINTAAAAATGGSSSSTQRPSTTSMQHQPPRHVQLHIVGDSQLVLRQVQGHYKCNKPHLRVYLQRVQDLLSQLSRTASSLSTQYQHVLRAHNTIADQELIWVSSIRAEAKILHTDASFSTHSTVAPYFAWILFS